MSPHPRRLVVRDGRRVERNAYRISAGGASFRNLGALHARRLARGDGLLHVVQHDLGRADVPVKSRGGRKVARAFVFGRRYGVLESGMAERSFKREVQKLRLGEGEEFHGEGILAVTKALLQSGVSYVAGYQGAPISHLMDVLADANEILEGLGVHFENSANEATAAASLVGSVNYPLRGAVTFKSTVGTNVASDALANLASGGVTGGALVIIGEDYGEGSSIMQERVHAFAMKSQMWLLDPRPNLPSIVRAVETGFELSEV